MPDISMCRGDGCPRKYDCYRYRAVPSPHRQAYMLPPRQPDGSCTYFAELRKGDDLIALPPPQLPVARVIKS